jgi:allophanate hydrolase subunit 1
MGVDELISIHSGSVFWILFIGFSPGLPVFVPIDPAKRVTAPKYKVPRTWTPVGTLGIGGVTNAIYSVESPGGYQMLGRTPIPIYDLEARNPIFNNRIVLLRPGDRIIFEPITHKEYISIEKNISSYTYQFQEDERSIDMVCDEGIDSNVGNN